MTVGNVRVLGVELVHYSTAHWISEQKNIVVSI